MFCAILATRSVPASLEPALPQWRRLWPLALALVAVVLSIALLAWPR
jgi:hypothetical protein